MSDDALRDVLEAAGIVPQRFDPAYPVEQLTPHPENPNRGNQEIIGESLDEHGFFGSVLVQESSGTIIAGEHRWRGQKNRGSLHVPAMFLDVDDDQARRIMLVDNRAAELAYRDPGDLAKVLAACRESGNMKGTGYQETDLEDLLASLEVPDLDDLADELGEPEEDSFWPQVRFRCPPDLHDRWEVQVKNSQDDPVVALRTVLDALKP